MHCLPKLKCFTNFMMNAFGYLTSLLTTELMPDLHLTCIYFNLLTHLST